MISSKPIITQAASAMKANIMAATKRPAPRNLSGATSERLQTMVCAQTLAMTLLLEGVPRLCSR